MLLEDEDGGYEVPASPPPARGRSPSRDLTVQVRHDSDGLWHRRAAIYGYTACGLEATARTTSNIRTERYDERLCEGGCFSDFELLLSARANNGEPPTNPI